MAKYSTVRRQLSTLDPRDRRQATDIARRQLLRANQRITAARADELLEIVRADTTADGSWQLARGRHSSRASSIQSPIHVETDNRFLPLADMEEDANDQFNHSDLLDILDTEVEPHSEVVPPTPKKRRETTPPSAEAARDKKAKVAKPVDVPFTVPRPPGPGQGTPIPASKYPGVPVTTTTTDTPVPSTSGHTATAPSPAITPLPSPSTSAASSATRTPRRLSVFNAARRSTWAIPEVGNDETTLLLTDSNGVALSEHTPATWRVATYRGGYIRDINRILESCPIPPHVTSLVIAVGINDRDSASDKPWINDISRLRELLQLQRRKLAVLKIPAVDGQPIHLDHATERLNQLLSDYFGELRCLVDVPADLVLGRIHGNDYKHFDSPSARVLVQHITTHLDSLN